VSSFNEQQPHAKVGDRYDVFRTDARLYFVLEYIEGGELFDIVSEEKNFTEKQASQVMKGILLGVKYLHDNQIAHRYGRSDVFTTATTNRLTNFRDLKLENILVVNKQWPLQVKITDFGLSGLTDGKQVLTSFVGTPFYLSPEIILQHEYGSAVDMWSCGVILYVILAGKFPFGGASDLEYLKQVVRKDIRFPDDEWRDISSECKSFILRLLEKNPKKRYTADEALNDPWITNTKDRTKTIKNDRQAMHSSRRLPRIDKTRESIKLSKTQF